MKNESILFRKNRLEINYSNSFNFRSRCKKCCGLPCGTVARQPHLYAFTSPKEFKNNTNRIPQDSFLRFPKKSHVKMHLTSYQVRGMNVDNFRLELNKYLREEFWNRMISCKCGLTWWIYKNKTTNHSSKNIKINKK